MFNLDSGIWWDNEIINVGVICNLKTCNTLSLSKLVLDVPNFLLSNYTWKQLLINIINTKPKYQLCLKHTSNNDYFVIEKLTV